MSDLDILQLFAEGKYIADLENGVVLNRHGEQVAEYPGNEEGHRYIRLYGNGKRRATAVHRIIWIVGSQSEIPAKWEIHHHNEDVTDNSFDNLFCLHPRDHRKIHARGLIQDTTPF